MPAIEQRWSLYDAHRASLIPRSRRADIVIVGGIDLRSRVTKSNPDYEDSTHQTDLGLLITIPVAH